MKLSDFPGEKSLGVVSLKEGYSNPFNSHVNAFCGGLTLFTIEDVKIPTGGSQDTWGVAVTNIKGKTKQIIPGCQIKTVSFITETDMKRLGQHVWNLYEV